MIPANKLKWLFYIFIFSFIVVRLLSGWSYFSLYQTNAKKTSSLPLPVFVVVLAYSRSGSSFLGELLSLPPHATYVFEPFFETRHSDNSRILQDILRCDADIFHRFLRHHKIFLSLRRIAGYPLANWSSADVLQRWSPQYMEQLCLASSVVVVKTIRLKVRDLMPVILEGRVPLKVVHLVRDPRAILHSMWGSAVKTWIKANSTKICHRVMLDVKLGDTLPDTVYTRVTYESLVINRTDALRQIYNFLGVPSPWAEIQSYVKEHSIVPKVYSPGEEFYDTHRRPDFDPNHWRREAPKNATQKILKDCRELIKTLHYDVVPPPVKRRRG